MRQLFGTSLFISLLSLSWLSPALAENSAPQQASDTTNAIAFAVQAGQIAGTAQACGIDIATFTTRVSEAINKLALNPTDSTAATNSFQQTLQQAQIIESKNHTIACSQVNQDFSNLPLLKPDYEQSVIAQLAPNMTGGQSNTNTSTNTSAPATNNQANTPSNNSTPTAKPNQQNLSNQPMPNNNAVNNKAENNTPPPNPAYPKQNYGTSNSFSTNFSGAIKPYGMANMPQGQSQAAAPPAANNAQTQNNYSAPGNNPPPPSFSNPNNAP